MFNKEIDFNIGPVAGWLSTRPETRSLGVMFVWRMGSFELHIGLLFMDFCIFTKTGGIVD